MAKKQKKTRKKQTWNRTGYRDHLGGHLPVRGGQLASWVHEDAEQGAKTIALIKTPKNRKVAAELFVKTYPTLARKYLKEVLRG